MEDADALARLIADLSRPGPIGRGIGRLVDGRPRLTRLLRGPMRLRPVVTLVTRTHAWLLRRSGGRLRRSWLFAAGQPVMSLTTTGRRSGLPRTTAVAGFVFEARLATAAMNLGGARDPAWALNLAAHPEATIALAGRTFAVRARRARGEEAVRAWARWRAVQPSAPAFRDLAGREIPIYVLEAR